MRSLQVAKGGDGQGIFEAARKSQLYDRKLKMYRVNAP